MDIPDNDVTFTDPQYRRRSDDCMYLQEQLQKQRNQKKYNKMLIARILQYKDYIGTNVCFFMALVIEYIISHSPLIKEFLIGLVNQPEEKFGQVTPLYKLLYEQIHDSMQLSEFAQMLMKKHERTTAFNRKNLLEMFLTTFIRQAKKYDIIIQFAYIEFKFEYFEIITHEMNENEYPIDILFSCSNFYPLDHMIIDVNGTTNIYVPDVLSSQFKKLMKIEQIAGRRIQEFTRYRIPWQIMIPEKIPNVHHPEAMMTYGMNKFYLFPTTPVNYITLLLLSIGFLDDTTHTNKDKIDIFFRNTTRPEVRYVLRLTPQFKFIDWYMLLTNYFNYPENILETFGDPRYTHYPINRQLRKFIDDPNATFYDPIVIHLINSAMYKLTEEIRNDSNSRIENMVYVIMFVVTLYDYLPYTSFNEYLTLKSMSFYLKLIFDNNFNVLDKFYKQSDQLVRELKQRNMDEVDELLHYRYFLDRIMHVYFIVSDQGLGAHGFDLEPEEYGITRDEQLARIRRQENDPGQLYRKRQFRDMKQLLINGDYEVKKLLEKFNSAKRYKKRRVVNKSMHRNHKKILELDRRIKLAKHREIREQLSNHLDEYTRPYFAQTVVDFVGVFKIVTCIVYRTLQEPHRADQPKISYTPRNYQPLKAPEIRKRLVQEGRYDRSNEIYVPPIYEYIVESEPWEVPRIELYRPIDEETGERLAPRPYNIPDPNE